MRGSRRRLSLAAYVVVLGLLSACAASPAPATELHYGLTLVPTGIDPHMHASSELGIPLRSVYDTLVYRDDSGSFVPGLATRWTVSPDGRTYTFQLRQDVRFHDGTRFNAEAVRVNLNRILDPATQSQKAAFMLGQVQSIEVVDDYTLRLQLAEPFAALLDSLSQPYLGMASPAALAKWGVADYQFHQVGTGPYRFVEYVPGDHLTLERNPDYAWAPSIYRHSQAQIDRIVFRFYADPATRAPALLSGEADVMGEVPPEDAKTFAQEAAFQLIPVPIPGLPLEFFFNTQRSPTDELNVRRALILATDRKAIVQTVFGGLSPVATSALSASTWGFVETLPASQSDPAEAARLLDAAGWALSGGQTTRSKAGQPLSLEVVMPPWGFTPQVAQMLELQWARVGVQVRLTPVPSFAALGDAQKAGRYNLIASNLSGADPDVLRSFYATDGSYNYSSVADVALDAALEAGARASDPAERRSHYAEAEQRIADLALLLPIRDYTNLNVARATVKGLRFDAQGWFPILIDVTR